MIIFWNQAQVKISTLEYLVTSFQTKKNWLNALRWEFISRKKTGVRSRKKSKVQENKKENSFTKKSKI